MSDPSPSPFSSPLPAQHWVRVGVGADAAMLDAWLMARAPLAVPEARARRLSLEALLAQGGQGLCLVGGTTAVPEAVECLLPVPLIHSLGTGGRLALVSEWWGPQARLAPCLDELADWCRAHGIRAIAVAPGLAGEGGAPAPGYERDGSGLWLRSLVPTAKRLG
ncbi:hypothetical protein [Cupriavidus agavae]|uniref:Uncharacterized protein n=1 Tax=Cupriavidus agavae TaxID=1001822 RepID=A0A4Q7R9B2_9BURK|nr:hypothetical protein [Cupriavidus agavae]RZT29555.1 hypothetical protein EV147_4754 [Cupriavidus agavae]